MGIPESTAAGSAAPTLSPRVVRFARGRGPDSLEGGADVVGHQVGAGDDLLVEANADGVGAAQGLTSLLVLHAPASLARAAGTATTSIRPDTESGAEMVVMRALRDASRRPGAEIVEIAPLERSTTTLSAPRFRAALSSLLTTTISAPQIRQAALRDLRGPDLTARRLHGPGFARRARRKTADQSAPASHLGMHRGTPCLPSTRSGVLNPKGPARPRTRCVTPRVV